MGRSDSTSTRDGRVATAGLLVAVAILFVTARTVLADESGQTPTGGNSSSLRIDFNSVWPIWRKTVSQRSSAVEKRPAWPATECRACG